MRAGQFFEELILDMISQKDEKGLKASLEKGEEQERRRRTELYSRDSWGSTKRKKEEEEKKDDEKKRKSGKINRCRAGTHTKKALNTL